MAIINIPDQNKKIEGFEAVQKFLKEQGIAYDTWEAKEKFSSDATPEAILKAYEHKVKPFMQQGGFQSSDVISVNENTPNIGAIRQKFLTEHTHSDDEVRFFVEGQGLFWFHLSEQEPVFSLHCVAGDFLAVPTGSKHWFDLGIKPHLKAIRIFTSEAGWVANYTESGIDKKYNPAYES